MLRCLRKRSALSANKILRGNVKSNFQNTRCFSANAAFKSNLNKDEDKIREGKIYHGFLCTDIQDIKEFNMKAMLFKHEKSKAEYLHLQRDDPNNVFSINFRTTPFNSTGLPHILEHTVLCGSKKYPVRDPFFKMLNRSLATFMNAMTGPDYTFYPFSSQNEVDYRNLQKIYLDAVFQPNLNHLDFLQEGWRLEHSDVKDPNSNLNFKGVVFNEMKGAFSENSAIFGQKFLNRILPDHTYGFVSGGDPLEIPNLSLKELKDFHQMYYHPSNCRIYSYGNFPVERNLEVCNELYLKNCYGIDSSYSKVPSQLRWKTPIEQKIRCRFDKMGAPIENQNQIAIGYLMADITNVYETYVLQFLSELMVMGPNSQFYKSLIEPNISGGYNSLTGYDAHMRDTMFIVGLQDLEVDKFDRVKEIFDDTLDKVIKEGFDKMHIESVLHGIELSIKHQSTNFGLNLLFNLVPLWNHEGPIIEALQIGKFLDKFKNNLSNPKYLTERVEHYFKLNSHKLTMTMVPDEMYENENTKLEEDLLQDKISKLTKDDKKHIYDEGLKLAESQKTSQNIDILPCLSLKDIPESIPPVSIKNLSLKTVPAQICQCNTNNVTYFRAILDTSSISKDLRMLIPVFNSIVSKMDTKNHGYREFDQLIHLKTGGLSFSTHVADRVDNVGKYEQGILLSSHALDHNINGMLSIWLEIFEKPIFKDKSRFKMLLDNYVSSLTPGIASNGHFYAMQCASSLVGSSSLLREELSGLKHIDFMKNIVKVDETEVILQKMSSIADKILNGSKMRMALNLSETEHDEIVNKFENFCQSLPKDGSKSQNDIMLSAEESFDKTTNCIHYMNNFSVNYCSKAIKTVPFNDADFAKLRVLAKFLSSKYLHPIVREQNGAYGGGARISNNGIFSFFSYRDPNARVTLDVFDGTSEWLKNSSQGILDDQAVFESKLGVLQQVDSPIAPCNRGFDLFLQGINNDMLEKHRRDVLNVTKDDLIEVCEKYLVDDQPGKLIVGKCVVGPGESAGSNKILTTENEKWNVIQPIPEG